MAIVLVEIHQLRFDTATNGRERQVLAPLHKLGLVPRLQSLHFVRPLLANIEHEQHWLLGQELKAL